METHYSKLQEARSPLILENPGKFEKWANSFLLITPEELTNSKTIGNCKTLEETKMAFSNEYQALFEASWNLRKLKSFPIENWFTHRELGDEVVIDWYGYSFGRMHCPCGGGFGYGAYGSSSQLGDGFGKFHFRLGGFCYGLGYENGAGHGQKVGGCWNYEY